MTISEDIGGINKDYQIKIAGNKPILIANINLAAERQPITAGIILDTGLRPHDIQETIGQLLMVSLLPARIPW